MSNLFVENHFSTNLMYMYARCTRGIILTAVLLNANLANECVGNSKKIFTPFIMHSICVRTIWCAYDGAIC